LLELQSFDEGRNTGALSMIPADIALAGTSGGGTYCAINTGTVRKNSE
jgi:hypothetical protein